MTEDHRTPETTSRPREVDARGNCSKCGGTHYGTGWYCPMSQSPQGESPIQDRGPHVGNTSEPVATEPQGSAGESPAPIPLASNQQSSLPKQSVELIRATLEDMRKNGLTGGLPQEHAFTLLEEIERLNTYITARVCMSQTEWHAYLAERDRLKAALLELVACKDLREKIDGELSACHQEISPQLKAMQNEYQIRKPLAWRDAKAALSGEHSAVETSCRQCADAVSRGWSYCPHCGVADPTRAADPVRPAENGKGDL